MNRLINFFVVENSEEGGPSNNTNSSSRLHCEPGIFLPPWMPQEDVSTGQIVGRGIVYVLSLAYIFVGIGFLTHKFMASILMVTSKRKEVKVRDENGNMQTVVVQIWNQTVAAITLMAMGCSMPEVLLTIIEVVGHNFETGELGPCSTVGSAVFNMCFVIAVCNFVIPKGEIRRIKRLGVHLVMSVWSAFAYVWLYLIVIVISPGEIEVWESVLTLVFFPLMVVSAYIADKSTQKMSKTYRMGSNNILIETTSDSVSDQLHHLKQFPEELESKEMHQFEDDRRRFLAHLQTLRRTHPEFDADELELMAAAELFEKGTISRAFHRMTVATKLTGFKSIQIRQKSQRNDLLNLTRRPVVVSSLQSSQYATTQVSFNPGHYTVSETTNKLRAVVERENGDLMRYLLVDYETDDGGAVASKNYVPTKGTICFQPGEIKQEIQIEILQNLFGGSNHHFYIRLSNARFTSGEDHLSVPLSGNNAENSLKAQDNHAFFGDIPVNNDNKNVSVNLVSPSIATVMILDDNHHGIFSLFESEVSIKETVGYYNFQVIRRGGSRGCVSIKYRTESGTAKPGKDYRHCEGELLFEDGDVEKGVSVPIFVKNLYEKNVVFFLTLDQPILMIAEENEVTSHMIIPTISLKAEKMGTVFDNRPQLGQVHQTLVRIHESTSFKNLVDKIMKKSKVSVNRGMDAWKHQIISAFHIDESHGDDDQQPIRKDHTWTAYLEYFITFFWRLVWAIFLPPEILGGGYPCLLLCVGFIGFIITIVFDLASALGCTIGLADAVTAVAFIAIGTCLPDLFASKIACVRDEHADDSIINVTGANAINVYLGVGVAWFMAVIKKTVNGEVLQVKGGELLGFVLSIYVGLAVLTTILLLIRRLKTVSGGELGGPLKYKIPTSILLSSLWILFVIATALDAYGYILA